ncbi:MAG: ABC transporter permease [bacterium]|nr:ABC transporter permease [bacterium]
MTALRLHHTVRTAFRALLRTKSRTMLTILGIVIGIAAIMLVTAVGRGAQNLILDQVSGLGSQIVFIEPGREPRGPADFVEAFTDSLTVRDVVALRRLANVPDAVYVSPSVVQIAPVSYGNETYRAQVHGHDEHFMEVFDIRLAFGTPITEDDVARRAHVALIGDKVRTELFGDSDPIGATVQIKGRKFRVIGTMPPKGQAAFIPYDELVVIPHTTVQKYLLGIDYFHMIAMTARRGADLARVKRDIELTLREQHGIMDPSKDDFHVMTQEDIIARIGIIGTALTALLTAIAAIALVVGGIGIMNIMLVAVTERTREIGLRKALGATSRDIRQQFLVEAIALTTIGGAIGVLLGTTLAAAIAFVLSHTVISGWTYHFPVGATVVGLITSAAVGIVFGLYPASQAAKKSPIEALRYE